jgi:hypothetical protein
MNDESRIDAVTAVGEFCEALADLDEWWSMGLGDTDVEKVLNETYPQDMPNFEEIARAFAGWDIDLIEALEKRAQEIAEDQAVIAKEIEIEEGPR